MKNMKSDTNAIESTENVDLEMSSFKKIIS